MKRRVLAIVVALGLMTAGAVLVAQQLGVRGHSVLAAGSSAVVAARPLVSLPSATSTKMLLEGAVHQSEFVSVPVAGHDPVRAYISYPDRADKAPVVVVTAPDQGMTDWTRAAAYQVSRDGFVAVVPDYRPHTDSGARQEALREYLDRIPSADGTIAGVEFFGSRISARVGTSPAATLRSAIRDGPARWIS
jgi:hypothetical protein